MQTNIRQGMKGLVFAALSAMSVNAFAVAPGFYMGLMTGPATNTGGDTQVQTSTNTLTTANPKSSQFGTRIFLGYKMNQYAGTEFGLNFFTGIKYDTKDVDTCDSPQVRVRDFDFLGKFSTTFWDSVAIYGKAGVALAYVNESGSLNPDLSQDCGDSRNSTNLKPEVAVGVSYDLNQNWVVDLSWTRLMVGTKAGDVDFYAMGISYHFVDEYCGQFLCES